MTHSTISFQFSSEELKELLRVLNEAHLGSEPVVARVWADGSFALERGDDDVLTQPFYLGDR